MADPSFRISQLEDLIFSLVNALLSRSNAWMPPAAPPDAAEWDGVENKFETYFSEEPGEGD